MYKVLEPIKVGNFTLKNRMMFLAMAKYIDNEDYTISDREIAYMAERAKGGAAVVCTGCCVIDNDYPGRLPNQPGMFDDKFIPGMKKLADAVHQYGALVLMQPLHHGIANYNASKETEKNPNNFTREDMEHLKQLYVDAAIRCKKAGIDGFEIHAAHNYLLQEFMVPKWNARTDEYGIQNPENASRFICEIVRAVREAVGLDFLLPFKVNGSDFVEGGCDIEFVSECCKYVEAAGVDFIAVSGGGSESNIFAMSADGHREEGWKVPLAEVVKSKVKIPVMGTGSIRTPAYIEEILSAGKVDMIGMGRGLLAEPEWINKVAAGRECDLNQCINCLQCFDIAPIPGNSGCSVNPYALRESEHLVPRKDGQGRVVAVIGGGAAGMQAAITLAERAFQPVIFEETASLGGPERYAAMPEG
ncbi:MAG: NADH:flavin oxidoreductase, partial [Oscillibacter sp.]